MYVCILRSVFFDKGSRLNALYEAVNRGADVWFNDNRFKIVRELGEGGFAYVFLVREAFTDASASGASKKFKDPSHISDGTYAMKKVLIHNNDQLELVKEEIRVSSLFSHPNLQPLLYYAIIPVKIHLDGTLLDNSRFHFFA
ncbi:hypothetical protein Lser_V15G36690 [Lactuca serriola]